MKAIQGYNLIDNPQENGKISSKEQYPPLRADQ
jgi:hypothetical protein